MPKYFWDVEQRSEEWDQLRLGMVTASTASKILTPTGKLSKQSDKLMHQLLAEWYFGGPLEDPQSQYQSQWMERGTFLENRARQAYEFETGRTVKQCGFVTTDDGRFGCSPDGLIDEDRVLELKVPSPTIHMGYMVNRCVDDDYFSQIQMQLFVTERKYVDIQSYCDPFPTVVISVPRDDEFIGKLHLALIEFDDKMQRAKTLLVQTYGPPIREQVTVQPPASAEDEIMQFISEHRPI